MIQGSDIVVCGTLMWIHVSLASLDTCVMTRVASCQRHVVWAWSTVCRVCLYEVSELTIAVATCLNTRVSYANLHLGYVFSHMEIFKYFLLYLLYVDNYFHRIKIYLQRKHCLLFHSINLLACLKTSFLVEACLHCAILLRSYWFSLKSYHLLSIVNPVNYCALRIQDREEVHWILWPKNWKMTKLKYDHESLFDPKHFFCQCSWR